MLRKAVLLIAGALALRSQPALPYLDWNACPFEGCVYRQWTARKALTVYDNWKPPRRAVAEVSPGERVEAITGVVITFRPGVIRMDRALPAQNLKAGDIILTYAYRGEGCYAAWVHGRYEPEFEVPMARWPASSACIVNGSCAMDRSAECFLQCVGGPGCMGAECAATVTDLGQKVWWGKVKLASGRSGWIQVDPAALDGIDLLAGAAPAAPFAGPRKIASASWTHFELWGALDVLTTPR